MAANFGFRVTLAHDAMAAFDRKGYDGKTYPAEEIHRTALASLNGEFATVVGSESLL
jgi:nicotinamidase-related amidase